MTRRLRLWPAACALVLLAACSKHPTESITPPSSSLPPQITATNPPARSTGIPYDTEIWAQFDRALDPATVNGTSVFLKLDARRIAATIGYEDITRRVRITPQVVLDLQKTYTIEFSTAVKGRDGTALPRTAFFQFTTNSLRRTILSYPSQDTLEGPFSALGWIGNGPPSNNIFYEVYASTDSSAVERLSIPYVQRSVFISHVPRTSWGSDAKVYWTVVTENTATGERLPSALRHFQTYPASAPVDSVTIIASDWGANSQDSRTVQYCGRNDFPTGPRFVSAMHWSYGLYPTNAKLAYARIELTLSATSSNSIAAAQPSVWLTQNDWAACSIVAPGTPYIEPGARVASVVAASTVLATFQSEALTAFFEAQGRRRPFVYGTAIKSDVNLLFNMSTAGPRAILYYYR